MPSREQLKRYADVAIQVGLGFREGDRLVVTSPIDARDFTRLVVEAAYERGAANVDVVWADDVASKARFAFGTESAASAVTGFSHLFNSTVDTLDCMLHVLAEDPNLMADQDQELVARFRKTNSEFCKPFRDSTGSYRQRWTVVSAPTPPWAASVFPDMDIDTSIETLWGAILRSCRADQDDPIGRWESHVAHLAARCEYLNAKEFDALRYQGPGTDLVVGLPDGHRWIGGQAKNPDGIGFVPNLPTEEVFTSPDRLRAEGTVRSTKPLNLFGSVVEDFSFTLANGEVVSATAGRGQETVDELLKIDEGSVRFGEVALVPQSSAVASEGLIWKNMLFDENDACHIALGTGFPAVIEGGGDMGDAELVDRGINQSSVHVDFVVGSKELDIYGVAANGDEEPVLIGGEWAFDV